MEQDWLIKRRRRIADDAADGQHVFGKHERVNSGTLNLSGGGSISSTNFNIGGGTVNVNAGGTIASANVNVNSGSLNLNAVGALSGATTNLSITGAPVTVNAGASISSTNLNLISGTLNVASTGSITGAGATVASGTVLNVASGGLVPAAWNLTDNGSVTFSSPATTIGTLGGTGVVNLNSDTLTIAGGGTVGAILQDGSISNPGALSVTGGTLILIATNTYTGGTTIGALGTLQIGNGVATGSSIVNTTPVVDNGALAYDLPTGSSVAPNVTNNGTVIFNSPGTLNANISNITATTGTIQQLGAGTASITGTMTNFTGKFVVGGTGTLLFNYPTPTTISNPIGAVGTTGAVANAGKLTLSGSGKALLTTNVRSRITSPRLVERCPTACPRMWKSLDRSARPTRLV